MINIIIILCRYILYNIIMCIRNIVSVSVGIRYTRAGAHAHVYIIIYTQRRRQCMYNIVCVVYYVYSRKKYIIMHYIGMRSASRIVSCRHRMYIILYSRRDETSTPPALVAATALIKLPRFVISPCLACPSRSLGWRCGSGYVFYFIFLLRVRSKTSRQSTDIDHRR